MSASINPMTTRLGEGRDIAAIGFHASAAVPIHQAVIRIRHDDFVTQRLEMLCDPFTRGRGFDQNPGVWTAPEKCGQSIMRGPNALIDHLPTLREDSHLAFFLVQVDGSILYGWSPLLRLRARLRSVEQKLPPTKEASRFIVSVSPETLGQRRHLQGHVDAHRCCRSR